jgi:hypothetical protein
VLLNTRDQDPGPLQPGRAPGHLAQGRGLFLGGARRGAAVHRRGRRPPPEHGAGGVPGPQARREPVDVLVNQGQVDLAPSDADPRPPWRSAPIRGWSCPTIGRAAAAPIAPEIGHPRAGLAGGQAGLRGRDAQPGGGNVRALQRHRIQIRDPGLAREPVTGLFAANDPGGFSRAIARVFDAKLEQAGDEVVLTRPPWCSALRSFCYR